MKKLNRRSLLFGDHGGQRAAGAIAIAVSLLGISTPLAQTNEWATGAHNDAVYGLQISPDGRFVASGSLDGTIKVWQVGSGPRLLTLKGHTGYVLDVAYSPDGSVVASGGSFAGSYTGDGVKLWNANDGSLIRTLSEPGSVRYVRFSPDGALLAVAANVQGSYYAKVYSTADWSLVKTLQQPAYCLSLAFSHDGKLLAVGGQDAHLQLFSVATWQSTKQISGFSGHATGIDFSPDDAQIVVGAYWASGGGYGTALSLFRVADGSLLQAFYQNAGATERVFFSPDGSRIASADDDSKIRIFRASDGGLIQTLSGHTSHAIGLDFSPDGRLIASGSYDKTIKIWRVSNGNLIRTLGNGHFLPVNSVAVSSDGTLVASASDDKVVKLFSGSDGGLITNLVKHTDQVLAVAIAPNKSFVVSGGADKAVRVWDAASGGYTAGITSAGMDAVRALAIAPDGNLIASGGNDGKIRLWKAIDWSLANTLPGHDGWVLSLAISPDGQYLASGGNDYVAKLWRLSDGALLKTMEDHTLDVTSVAFSPDGTWLATGSWDKKVMLYQMPSGSLSKTLTGHTADVTSVAFSADSKVLASAAFDNSIRLWNVADGSLLKAYDQEHVEVRSLAFSANSLLVYGRADGAVIARTPFAANAPVIVTAPETQTSYLGKSVSFSVEAQGAEPLYYQWFKDGTTLAQATNSILILNDLKASDAGVYSVQVSNASSSVTTPGATLIVYPAGVEIHTYAGLTISGITGKTYAIQASTNLSDTNAWVSLTNLTLNASEQVWIDMDSAKQAKRYYKVTLP